MFLLCLLESYVESVMCYISINIYLGTIRVNLYINIFDFSAKKKSSACWLDTIDLKMYYNVLKMNLENSSGKFH